MMILKLFDCSGDTDYGLLIVKNKKVRVCDIQEKIYDFKNSFGAYGYSSFSEMQKDGYKTLDDLIAKGIPVWDIDTLVEKAFPKSWEVSGYEYNGVVDC